MIYPSSVTLSNVTKTGLFEAPYATRSHIMQIATNTSHAEIIEFTILSHCNGTVISNTNGVLHALINGE